MAKIHIKNKNWPEYTIYLIRGLSISFFKKANNIMMKKYAILFTKIVFKQLFKKIR